MSVANVLLEQILTGKGAVDDTLISTDLNVVLVEVRDIVNRFGAKHASLIDNDGSTKHTNPLDVGVAVYAGLVPLPAVKVFEDLGAYGAVILSRRVGAIVARCVGRRRTRKAISWVQGAG